MLAGVIVLAYPAAYGIWRTIRDERWKTAVLLLCIVPFWTSYLTRAITWLPMFGREGVVNSVLLFLGIINQPIEILLYTPYSMMWALWFLYIVFMIGPLYHSMRRIDEDVMSAAAVFGATPLRTFFHVVLPLTKPGPHGRLALRCRPRPRRVLYRAGHWRRPEPHAGGPRPAADRHLSMGVGISDRRRADRADARHRHSHVAISSICARSNPADRTMPFRFADTYTSSISAFILVGSLLSLRHHGRAVLPRAARRAHLSAARQSARSGTGSCSIPGDCHQSTAMSVSSWVTIIGALERSLVLAGLTMAHLDRARADGGAGIPQTASAAPRRSSISGCSASSCRGSRSASALALVFQRLGIPMHWLVDRPRRPRHVDAAVFT